MCCRRSASSTRTPPGWWRCQPADRRRRPRACAGLGGELKPFQRAGVAYLLAQRRAFLADEQGLGKTIEALATLEADEAYPAIVVCPASLKLNWMREIERWLPGRTVAAAGRRGVGSPATQRAVDATALAGRPMAANRATGLDYQRRSSSAGTEHDPRTSRSSTTTSSPRAAHALAAIAPARARARRVPLLQERRRQAHPGRRTPRDERSRATASCSP